jgi:hypothetical protein
VPTHGLHPRLRAHLAMLLILCAITLAVDLAFTTYANGSVVNVYGLLSNISA